MLKRDGLRLILAAALAALPLSARAQTTLEVGAYPSNPPFEFKKPDGSFEGFEVDVVKAIAAKLGAEVKFTDLGFQALFAATSSRRIDLAISTIAVTPARLENQGFTQPYVDTGLVLAAGPASKVQTTADLKGKVVGAIATSTGENWIKENRERLGIGEMKTYDTQSALFLDTMNGRVDGAINDIGGVLYAMKSMKGMRIAERFPSTSRIAMMMPKNAPHAERVNEALSAIKRDGTMLTIWRKWFDSDPPEGSSTLTPMPLPKPAT
jgi:polar amino acid transport system substrate-binding protein